jgi:hypothetical protein
MVQPIQAAASVVFKPISSRGMGGVQLRAFGHEAFVKVQDLVQLSLVSVGCLTILEKSREDAQNDTSNNWLQMLGSAAVVSGLVKAKQYRLLGTVLAGTTAFNLGKVSSFWQGVEETLQDNVPILVGAASAKLGQWFTREGEKYENFNLLNTLNLNDDNEAVATLNALHEALFQHQTQQLETSTTYPFDNDLKALDAVVKEAMEAGKGGFYSEKLPAVETALQQFYTTHKDQLPEALSTSLDTLIQKNIQPKGLLAVLEHVATHSGMEDKVTEIQTAYADFKQGLVAFKEHYTLGGTEEALKKMKETLHASKNTFFTNLQALEQKNPELLNTLLKENTLAPGKTFLNILRNSQDGFVKLSWAMLPISCYIIGSALIGPLVSFKMEARLQGSLLKHPRVAENLIRDGSLPVMPMDTGVDHTPSEANTSVEDTPKVEPPSAEPVAAIPA